MPAGQPTKYNESFNEQARKLCLLGCTDRELADFFEVCEDTINNWKIDHPKFFESLKEGKKIANANVANSLYKRAVGFTAEEVTYEKVIIKDGQGFMKTTDVDDECINVDAYKKKVVTKEIAPDPGAALSFLKNREPDKWRDKQHVDVTTNGQSIVPQIFLPENNRKDAEI